MGGDGLPSMYSIMQAIYVLLSEVMNLMMG